MIYDHLTQLARYKGLHPNLDKALAFLEETDIGNLPLGRCDIDGERAFLMVQENLLDTDPDEQFEYHRRYLDIHFLLEGKEIIKYGRGVKEETQSYDTSRDIGFVACQAEYLLDLVDDYVAIFFPEEAHRPNIFKQNLKAVRKCVVKVLID